jgi:very-short-patch-repair endonuclease
MIDSETGFIEGGHDDFLYVTGITDLDVKSGIMVADDNDDYGIPIMAIGEWKPREGLYTVRVDTNGYIKEWVRYTILRRCKMPRRFARFPFIQKPAQNPARRVVSREPQNYSPIEVMFWNAYTATRPRALRGLVRQYPVGRYRLDFAIPLQKFGIELDGWATHASTIAIAADRLRQRNLEEMGWHVVRFGGREVHQNAAVCVRSAARLAALHKMKSRGR